MANPAHHDPAPQDWLIKEICTWIAIDINNSHVHEAMRSRGWWEVWAQLELLFALRPGVAGIGEVDREVGGIWPNSPNDRVDFWFKWNAQDPNQQQNLCWGVELKCRTNAEQHSVFNGRVIGDFTKCNQQPDLATHGRTAMYAVAISSDATDINDFNPYTWENTYYTTVSSSISSPIYVIWRIVQHGLDWGSTQYRTTRAITGISAIAMSET